MANVIEYIDEKWSFGKDGKNVTSIYKVKMDAATANEDEVYALTTVPKLYQAHPRCSDVVCNKIDIERDAGGNGTRTQFVVTCTFAPPESANTDTGNAEDPLSPKPWEQAPEVYFGMEVQDIPLTYAYRWKDKDGTIHKEPRHVLTSAGSPFDPPATYQAGFLIVNITTNVRGKYFDYTIIETYSNTVNDDDIVGAGIRLGEGDGFLRPIQAQVKYTDQSEQYWVVQYQIAVRGVANFVSILDQDYRIIDPSASSLRRELRKSDIFSNVIKGSEDDGALEDPVKLDGEGNLLAEGEDPVYIGYLPYRSTDWTALPGIPVRLAKRI